MLQSCYLWYFVDYPTILEKDNFLQDLIKNLKLNNYKLNYKLNKLHNIVNNYSWQKNSVCRLKTTSYPGCNRIASFNIPGTFGMMVCQNLIIWVLFTTKNVHVLSLKTVAILVL